MRCCYVHILVFRYDKNDKLWTMKHAREADFLATSRASESSLLLGSHFWVVHNDSVKCSSEEENSYMTNLTLHTCQPEQLPVTTHSVLRWRNAVMLRRTVWMEATSKIAGN